MNAMSKATVNLELCLGLSLLSRHHTVKNVFLYKDGKAHELRCEEPLSFSAFTKDEKDAEEKLRGRKLPGASRVRANSEVRRQ